jgi:hypothetical protein
MRVKRRLGSVSAGKFGKCIREKLCGKRELASNTSSPCLIIVTEPDLHMVSSVQLKGVKCDLL